MSKIKRLKKRFTAFVNQLTPDQVREQLVLAYLQMEKCQAALRGYDVLPVEMMDNGESSDLELFYRCKKTAGELAFMNNYFGVDVSTSENDKVGILLFKWPYVEDLISEFEMNFAKQSSKKCFAKGQEVWYMFGDRVQHSTIVGVVREVDGVTIYKTKLGHETAECETFGSLEELMENLKKTVNER